MTKRRRFVCATVAITAIAALTAACAPPPPPATSGMGSGARGTLPASTGAYFGAYLLPGGSGQAAEKASVAAEERYLGRKLDIVHWYYRWNSAFPTWRESSNSANGRIPLISWAGTNARSIANGSQDAVIRARADGVRSLGRPVMLRWFWEMDGVANRYKSVDPPTFKAAWNRIVSIFRARGAANAAFVWCPNAWGVDSNRAQQFYPGSASVDWICGDGYNWSPNKPGAKWTPFEQTFRAWYAWASTKGKPLMIGEVGAQEAPGSPERKAAWIREMGATLRQRMPQVRAVVYFDTRTGNASNPGVQFDWRLASSSSAHAAWRAVGLSSYFRPRHR